MCYNGRALAQRRDRGFDLGEGDWVHPAHALTRNA